MLEFGLSAVLGLAVAALAVIAVASRRPDTMTITRSADVAAAPEAIFPLINDLKLFSTWSPFEKDPAMTKIYSGADRGEGQRLVWNGNGQVGEGSVTITRSIPYSQVDMRLVMIRPMRGDNHVTFALVPYAGGTRVTWSIEGKLPLIAKVMQLFVDMDRMCGADFEKGLASLKARAERVSASAA